MALLRRISAFGHTLPKAEVSKMWYILVEYKLIEQYNPCLYVPNSFYYQEIFSKGNMIMNHSEITFHVNPLRLITCLSSAYLRTERVHRLKYLTYEVIHNYLPKNVKLSFCEMKIWVSYRSIDLTQRVVKLVKGNVNNIDRRLTRRLSFLTCSVIGNMNKICGFVSLLCI